MNKQSLFFTCLVAVVATALILMLLQFLIKKQNIKSEAGEKINTSFAIWFSSILITFYMFLKVALDQTENAIEIIISSKTIDDTFIQVMQRISVYTGFTFIFTFLSYYIAHNLLKLTMGDRIDSLEIGKDNKGYFIIKGVVLITLVFSIINIFEHFLHWFAPVVDTPFYH
ncbi:hypothetical protein [Flavobacterium sp.]|uniref:hypothetical protein n=1 Tax=Flavobacterium sp. TaxID=239 RepID=UPI003D6B20AC